MNGSNVADQGDEVDVELLGGDPAHWQTNVYAPSPRDKGPLWGVFGEIEDYPTGSVKQDHKYTVDWNAERIVWSVDGQAVRTVTKSESPPPLRRCAMIAGNGSGVLIVGWGR